jgi:hypothetical protein
MRRRRVGRHPRQNSEHLAKYKILVHKDKFQKFRKTLLASLHLWFESFVPDDAKQSADIYQGPPDVAPLYSDDNSGGEETYLSASVNTAMSYASVLSDWTFTDKSSPPGDNSTGTENSKLPSKLPTWADRVQGSSTRISCSDHSYNYYPLPDNFRGRIDLRSSFESSGSR